MEKKWYKSTKKTLGVVFALACLGGGIVGIVRDPTQTVPILQLWGFYSATCLGIKKFGDVIQHNKKEEI